MSNYSDDNMYKAPNWGYNAAMTQYKIAKQLGVSVQAVSQWYTGKTMPSPAHLMALSKLLDKSVETLLKEFLKKKEGK